MEIPGLDTIQIAVGQPPMEIKLPYKLIKAENQLQQAWTAGHIAIIPYCIKCKEPLIWHSPPEDDGILFHCPKCNRKWIANGDWKKEATADV